MTTLHPGTYLIELETSRPVEQKALARVMASLGFSRVVPDQMPEESIVDSRQSIARARAGALPGMTSAMSAARAYTAPVATAVNPLAYAAARAPVAKPVTTATTTVTQLAKAPSTAVSTVRKPAAMIDPATKLAERLPGYVQPEKKVVSRVSPYAVAPGAPKKKEPGMFDFGPGGGAPPPPSPGEPGAPAGEPTPGEPIPGEPTPGETAIDYPSVPLGRGPSAEKTPFVPGGAAPGGGAPQDYYEGSTPMPLGEGGGGVSTAPIVKALWQAWHDTGNPFGGAVTSGVAVSEGPRYVVRLIGELQRKIETQDSDLVRWVSVIPIGFEVFGDMSFNLYPYQLRSGRDYELRFVSRARSAPNREAVLALMSAMGWEPRKLSAIKKDMRLPGRAGANLALWYAVAQWKKPESRIVADDPFYFEDVKEVG